MSMVGYQLLVTLLYRNFVYSIAGGDMMSKIKKATKPSEVHAALNDIRKRNKKVIQRIRINIAKYHH